MNVKKNLTSAVSTYVKTLPFAPLVFFLTLIIFISGCTKEVKQPYLLGLGYGISSSTLVVNDLEAARLYYKDTLGFDVSDKIEKGTFDGSIVASIGFADMSSIELLSLNDTLADETKSSFITTFLEKYEGVRMYTLSSSSTDSTSIWLTSQGFVMDSIQSHRTEDEPAKGWTWDDGAAQMKSLDFESANPPAHLPRFMEFAGMNYKQANEEWKTYYSYGRRYSEHPNGVVGTAAIRLAVEDIEMASEEFKKMGFSELEANDTLARYQLIRNQEIHLIAPKKTGDELSDFLTTRGTGVFALRFEVINLDSTYQYLKERLPAEALVMNASSNQLTVAKEFAYGVQLEFIQEAAEQGEMAQMYRPDDALDSAAMKNAAGMYAKYCALCHGDDRQGYAADNAPSLRSKSLLATSKSSNFIRYTIQFGRSNTAMAGYMKYQGGPMEYIDIEILIQWLYQTAEVEEPIEVSRDPVLGDEAVGAAIYANNCAICHGKNGEGVSAPALGNPMLLATATDHFLRYAIAEGRDGTPMVAFKEILTKEEIDGVTAFLRSRASGWDKPKASTVSIPLPENYILNPKSNVPTFTLREGKYVSSEQVYKAMRDSLRMVILDARSEVAWRQTHIPGAIPIPYYKDPEEFVADIPNDSTYIVVYCACPHAASQKVVNNLKRNGFKNTAIIDEGVLIWAQLGYPVEHGK